MAIHDPRIEDISRAAEALIAGPPEFLRAFVGEEGARQIRRSILMASLRDQEFQGRVGVSVARVLTEVRTRFAASD